ncbi:hypothetical protein B9Z19DRAFT_474388 [Tuber borchii]|uniref:Uncharacterized protein n=1 Tax=Tuber borchii TaxID=42251 RepID=A0A2T7A363_TUBBO|nr:hypothetical protein B9Z19DRAFT_474388 [Tuber borchii]
MFSFSSLQFARYYLGKGGAASPSNNFRLLRYVIFNQPIFMYHFFSFLSNIHILPPLPLHDNFAAKDTDASLSPFPPFFLYFTCLACYHFTISLSHTLHLLFCCICSLPIIFSFILLDSFLDTAAALSVFCSCSDFTLFSGS